MRYYDSVPTPAEALEYAIGHALTRAMSTSAERQRARPGEAIARLGQVWREALQKLTSDDAVAMTTLYRDSYECGYQADQRDMVRSEKLKFDRDVLRLR